MNNLKKENQNFGVCMGVHPYNALEGVDATVVKDYNIPVIQFDGEFDVYPIQKLIYTIETIKRTEKYKDITLYFNSPGGYTQEMFSLIDYIKNLEGIKLNIVVNGFIGSAGFWFVIFASQFDNVFVSAGTDAFGMIHLVDIKTSVRDTYYPGLNMTNFLRQETDKRNEQFLEVASHFGLTDEQYNMLKNGQDVWITREELINCINNHYDWYSVKTGKLLNAYNGVLSELEKLENKKSDYEKIYFNITGENIDGTPVSKQKSKTKTGKK